MPAINPAVVATGPSGLGEQVVEGETGFVVPPGDEDALADALVRVLVHREIAERLGEAGRGRALALFTEDRHVESMLDLYRELLGPSGG